MAYKIIIVLFIAIILYFIISLVVFVAIFKRKSEHRGYITKKIESLIYKDISLRREANSIEYESNRKTVKIMETKYGQIYSEFAFAKKQTKKTVICCHGYKSSYKNFISGFYPCYKENELEYNLCVFDFYGCGLSSGKFLSMGKRTNETLLSVFNMAREIFGEDIEVYIHGISLGAYHALRFLTEYKSLTIKGLIFDSGFLNPFKQIKHLMRWKCGIIFLPLFPIWYLCFFGERFKKANLEKSIDQLKVPLIIFHGLKDSIVPSENSNKLFDLCVTQKQLVTFENSEHGLMCFDEVDEYRRRIKRFIENEHYNRICLIGFMGAGKTCLGKMVSDKYKLNFIDTDEKIVEDTGKNLDTLFAESEAEFRLMEINKLSEIFLIENAVLSCGGGTPQIPGSYEYLKKWTIIYLQISSELAFERSNGIKNYARPWEGFNELCKSRVPLFSSICDFVVSTDGDVNQSFEKLCQVINSNNLLKTRYIDE